MNQDLQPIILVSDKQERFAYYHLDEFRLGQGAMGEVFKGWCIDHPEEKVAIKRVFPRHARNRQIRERAKYEASLSIGHPNLIQMLGYSENRDGSIYIVSEYVRGNTINKFVETLDSADRLEIISRMMCLTLDALACLHGHRIWHRDIKPSNIMVENGCNVRLMDLGIATADGISFGTLEGKGFGTYPYAPPEQVMGQRNLVNGSSDLYSLGVTFYELLTGANPFLGGSDVDIMEKQITMCLPYNQIIPRPLFNVISKATAKEKSNRYQTAEEFKQAILTALKPIDPVPIRWELMVGVFCGVVALLFIIIFIL